MLKNFGINQMTDDFVHSTSCVPLENKDVSEFLEQPLFTVTRDVSVSRLSFGQISSNNLELDADILNTDTGEVICENRSKYIDNNNFTNAEEINRYLRFWGKIPSFLEVRETPGKGYGIFTTIDIVPDTFLGQYQGIPRATDEGMDTVKAYLFSVDNFYGNREGVVDGQNITYSNFTRFINHSDNPNCDAKICPLMVIIVTEDLIQKDTELTINYGASYWEEMKEMGYVKI
jgi:hypothetical protein